MNGANLDRCPYCGSKDTPCDCPNAEIDRLNREIASLREQLDHWSSRAVKAEGEVFAVKNNIRNLIRFANMEPKR